MRRFLISLLVLSIALLAAPPQAVAGPSSRVEKWAVLIGVNQYSGRIADLGGSVGDAQDLASFLMQNGWRSDHIFMLTDEQASADNIREAFRWLADRATNGSFSVVSFSGHIKTMSRDRDKDGEKVDEFLMATDGKLVSDRQFTDAMNEIPGWLWVNMSGCQSGGMDDGFTGTTKIMTASSRETQKSYDHPARGNSVFGGLMLDQGMLQGMADYNGDRRITLHEAFHYAWVGAPEMTHDQRKGAQNPVVFGGDDTIWFFNAPPPPPPPPKKEASSPPPEQQPPGWSPPQPQPAPQEEPPENCLIYCFPH